MFFLRVILRSINMSALHAVGLSMQGNKFVKGETMNRYIDTDDFEKLIKPYNTDDIIDGALYNFAHNHMMDTPTADVRENVHGEWIKNEDRAGWHCSCCGVDDFYAYLWDNIAKYELQDKYCPNCGAEMNIEDRKLLQMRFY